VDSRKDALPEIIARSLPRERQRVMIFPREGEPTCPPKRSTPRFRVARAKAPTTGREAVLRSLWVARHGDPAEEGRAFAVCPVAMPAAKHRPSSPVASDPFSCWMAPSTSARFTGSERAAGDHRDRAVNATSASSRSGDSRRRRAKPWCAPRLGGARRCPAKSVVVRPTNTFGVRYIGHGSAVWPPRARAAVLPTRAGESPPPLKLHVEAIRVVQKADGWGARSGTDRLRGTTPALPRRASFARSRAAP